MAFFYSSLRKLIQRVSFISVIKTRKLKVFSKVRGYSFTEMRCRSRPVLFRSLCAPCDVTILPQAASQETPPKVLRASSDTDRGPDPPCGDAHSLDLGKGQGTWIYDKYPRQLCAVQCDLRTTVPKDGVCTLTVLYECPP